ncbi:tyrosinase family protein [Telmatocola sphagniphila]|uniref:Tyrosinase family protein n=1 Tax=Telmatocola sphagniphila TaxID=1123043 RepID=A0A8E6B3U1_9BACT|nr:tyrosinase family protein [Telmatocola sphagniphila]QVL30804.1 tyrosinase family protein [Telmatocola sphagniphila]
MLSPITRRSFLESAGVTVASILTFDAKSQTPAQPNLSSPGVRENVAGMDENHPTLVSYRKAVAAMILLPETNPLSWIYQANMHGIPDGTVNVQPDWDGCMHGNWWFLPWHRGYLYYFERIIQKMSGDPSFYLPYWSWDTAGQNALPAPFRALQYQMTPNALYDAQRGDAANSGQPLRPNPEAGTTGSFAMDWNQAKQTAAFTNQYPELSFGGIKVAKTQLPTRPDSTDNHGVMESRAHDLIHDAVSGDMGDPRTAARDPIFWLHHANVDRLWNRWLDDRTHQNASDSDWLDQQFPYYDENGNRVVKSVSEILNLAVGAYIYDEEQRRVRTVAARPPVKGVRLVEPQIVGIASAQPSLKLNTKPFVKQLSFDTDNHPKLMTALNAPPKTDAEPASVLLRIEGIKPPAKPNLIFDVYLTLVGEKVSRKSYVGGISFFGRTGGGHGHAKDGGGFTQGFDITNTIQAIKRANKGKLPELQIHIIPHSTTGVSDDDLAKQNLDIPIANITIKLVSETNQ